MIFRDYNSSFTPFNNYIFTVNTRLMSIIAQSHFYPFSLLKLLVSSCNVTYPLRAGKVTRLFRSRGRMIKSPGALSYPGLLSNIRHRDERRK